ncbi:hypothetical protein CEUSTIGMA_g3983.t1 [Chlamydomonas eustigma]|uniref:Uncharacterized protein n=1 Tax=Chlamydomonas eustigma TaxID=1157962 RepID=A0A250X0D7_9CHLO|nr:hypothetical protein CEUSTIGMA_g3983.t1 [Chlamydomonas eustigma]|eukprot:GAX76537.1 hypothetical protein CEUSTIGMA_g3983.t1 [Chlamydomonas eustigma]
MKDGREILARRLKGTEIASWYFLPPTEIPGFHNEEREYVQQRNQNRRKKPEPGQAAEEAVGKGKKGKK